MLVNAQAGSEIHYTTNGAEPTLGDPTVPVGGVIIIQKSATLKAKAWLNGQESSVTVGQFKITGGFTAGAIHSVALKSNQTVFAWGQQQYGRLGNGVVTAANVTSPALMKKTATELFMGAMDVSAGYEHSAVLDTSGQVWAVGLNTSGQLGNNTATNSAYPVRVIKSATASDYLNYCRQVSVGDTFSVALADNGNVYAWGSQLYGKLGHGVTSGTRKWATLVETLSPVQSLAGIEQISAGANHVLARTAHASEAAGGTGQVWVWGQNTSGQLGLGDSVNRSRAVLSSSLSNITDVSSGLAHSAVVKKDATNPGRVYCFGEQRYGRLGNNFTTTDVALDVSTPVLVVKEDGSPLENIVEVAAGPRHTLARDSNNQVWSWGFNGDGELGIDSLVQKRCAVQVLAPSGQPGVLSGIVRIAAGGIDANGFSLALHEDGTVYAWGRNANGQLGLGTIISVSRPTAVGSLKLIDQGAPTGELSVSLPQQYEPVTASLNVVASDPDGAEDIASVKYSINGQLVGQVDAAPWSFPANQLLAGSYAASAVVTDKAGNVSHTNTVTFLVVSTVKVEAVRPMTMEGSGSGLFRVSRMNAQPTPLTVLISSGGTAISGVDYTALGTSVVIPANAQYVDVPVFALTDGVSESAETVVLQLQSSTEYQVSSAQAVASIQLFDFQDADSDGLADGWETQIGTSPMLSDSDGDGVPDAEDAYPLDGTRSSFPSATPGDSVGPLVEIELPASTTVVSGP